MWGQAVLQKPQLSPFARVAVSQAKRQKKWEPLSSLLCCASQLIWPRFTWANPLGSIDVARLLLVCNPLQGSLYARHPADRGQLGATPPTILLLNTYVGSRVSLINVTVHRVVCDWLAEDESGSINWPQGAVEHCWCLLTTESWRKARRFVDSVGVFFF